jgi:tRNA threonylcarbamoyladenosine modification (KEOPS) complex  Pcc1 subunit
MAGAKVSCEIHLEFASPEVADKVHRSVVLDNQGYIDSRVRESAIVAKVEAESLRSLLHTLDDFMACVAVAEGIVKKK